MMLGSGIGIRHPRPDRRALMFSLSFHATVVLALLASGILRGRDLPDFQTVRIRIYSPPPQVEGPPPPTPQVTPPKIVQAPVVEKPVAPPKPKEPVVKRPEQTVTTQEEKPKQPEPVMGANAKPDSPGGDNIDITQNGDDFPFPEYLNNVILQINRFFRWDGDNSPEAVIAFYIARDGSVGGVQTVEKSGDWRFDMKAIDAVTQIGKRGAFGPLPDGWVQDRLWVRFRFIPPGR